MNIALQKADQSKLVALVSFLLMYGFIYSPWTKFPYTFMIVISAILVLTYWQDKSFASLGLNPKTSTLRTMGLALLLFITIAPILDFVVQPLVHKLTGEVADYSAFQSLANDLPKYLKYVLFVIISASIGEELLFRGFVFRQFNSILPEFKYKVQTIVLLSAVLFCVPHLYQGLSGFIMTFIFGLVFATIYIKTGYNLWVAILFHALIDIMFLTLAYFDLVDYYTLANELFFGY